MSMTNEDFKQSLKKIKNNNSSENENNIIENSDKPSAPNNTQKYVELFKNLRKTEDESPKTYDTPKIE